MDSIDSIQPPERYKIVVFDAKTNKIVLSACKMFDIMDRNVTLVEMLESKRQPYTSLEAVYLLTPCLESVQRLMDDYPHDSPTGKYKAAHVLFTAPLEDRLFDRLTKSPVSKYIKSLKELFINFTAIESRVFSLESPASFYALYSPAMKMELSTELDSIAKQLVSVIATFGDYPSIRYFRPPETEDGKRTQSMKLAMLLQSELEAYIRSNPEVPVKQQGQGTILILDRSVDVAAAIVHEFTYQAMANDLLPIEDGTKYTYEVEDANDNMESTSAVIDELDQVFMEIRHAHIVETASTLTSKFNQFVAENEALRGDKDKATSLRNMKDQLANLPQFQDMKAKYSTHIHITKECMRIFESAKINEIGLVEQQLATGETVDGHLPKQILSEMIPFLDDSQISVNDKIRLLMLYMICRGGLRTEDSERLFELARVSDTDVEAIRNLGLLGVNVERGGSGAKSKKKPFYPKKRTEDEEQPYDLSRYITKAKRIVEEHLNGTLDATLYPFTTEAPTDSAESTRSLRKTPQPTWEKKKPNVKGSRLLVFIAGGVTYSEIRAMHELCHELGRDIIIGSTHIITPEPFMHSLRHLARGPIRPPAPIIPPYKSLNTPMSSPMQPGMMSQRSGPPSQPSSRPAPGPMNPSQGRPAHPPGPSSHRPIPPGYRGGPGGPGGHPAAGPGGPPSGGMRTIQKDASGRFVAPASSHGPPPPRSPAQAPPPFHGAGDTAEKKKGKMFGFI
ncbi:vacuolar sorting protein VPS33/slp1 [Mortierella polycephala]|uniref:Vacuolar sorting protein VPS33/slp1 n=1 Tax=Mortierella polycephala TaxID=41804 RepID=A0A9P6UAA7_9FUNG|nr:vacuolar sorting protein VPS33/slp1 [Mortierella polycephala]